MEHADTILTEVVNINIFSWYSKLYHLNLNATDFNFDIFLNLYMYDKKIIILLACTRLPYAHIFPSSLLKIRLQIKDQKYCSAHIYLVIPKKWSESVISLIDWNLKLMMDLGMWNWSQTLLAALEVTILTTSCSQWGKFHSNDHILWHHVKNIGT